MALNLAGSHAGACRNRHIDALWTKWSDAPVYAYEFNDRNAPYYFPPMPGFTPLAAHTIDIQFLFPLWHGGILGVPGASQSPALSKEEQRLSDQLVAAWTNFAKSGNPNESGNTPWPRFVNQEGVPAYLSQNVPTLSTFTNAQFGAESQLQLLGRRHCLPTLIEGEVAQSSRHVDTPCTSPAVENATSCQPGS